MQQQHKCGKADDPAARKSLACFRSWLISGIGEHDPEWLTEIVRSSLCPQAVNEELITMINASEYTGVCAASKRPGKKARNRAKQKAIADKGNGTCKS